eukprot:scaffold5386_cov98-Isochrysis_galbana.AAC.5
MISSFYETRREKEDVKVSTIPLGPSRAPVRGPELNWPRAARRLGPAPTPYRAAWPLPSMGARSAPRRLAARAHRYLAP